MVLGHVLGSCTVDILWTRHSGGPKNVTIRQFLEAIQAFILANFERKRTFFWGTELGQMVLGHVLGSCTVDILWTRHSGGQKNVTIRQFLEAIQAFISANFEQKWTFFWGSELCQMVLGHVLGSCTVDILWTRHSGGQKNVTIRQFLEAIQAFISANFE